MANHEPRSAVTNTEKEDRASSNSAEKPTAEIQSLEALLDDDDLDRVEEIASQFNIFSALRLTWIEMRHSDFLAWLLDPDESHGLHDYFLARFVKEVARAATSSGIEAPSLIHVNTWDFDTAAVRREWNNVDILVVCSDPPAKFVCVVENKIRSGEHGGQLARYKESVERDFHDYEKLYAFLTLEGENPTHGDFIPISYQETILPLMDRLLEAKGTQLAPDVRVLITHYREMLRRFVMENSELQSLCREIYKRHKTAMDLILEYRPDRQMEVRDILQGLIEKDDTMILEDSNKTSIRFIPKSLDFIPRRGTWNSRITRILLFEFTNNGECLALSLYVGPGDEAIRKQLIAIAEGNPKLFTKPRRLGLMWRAVYRKSVVPPADYKDADIEDVRQSISDWYTNFVVGDLPRIVEEFQKYPREVAAKV